MDKEVQDQNQVLAQGHAEFEADFAQFEEKPFPVPIEEDHVPVVLGEKVPASRMFQEGYFPGWGDISERINGCLYALECFERGPNVGIWDEQVHNDLADLFDRLESHTLTAEDWQRLENALLEDDLDFLRNF